ncbi:MAG: DNA repair exonuclease [Rhodospirillales bacterium]|nr:DNA repair exonuclease [Rhodospirillales bacterium]
MRFLHTADIHLDSPLTGLSAANDLPLDRLRESTRQALANLVDYALAEAVDFIVIAGDLYDGTWHDFTTGLYFVRQMARLDQAGIPAYVVLGNHDAENRLTRKLTLPGNVHVFPAERAETVFLPDRSVALHGRSFPTAAVGDNLVLAYPPAAPGCFNIGLLHTAAGGREAHANYAPCALSDLLAKGYDYWALGHVHAREVLHEHPHIVFPGNLQGRHIRETGTKSFTAVRVENGRVVAADPVAADVVRWLRCPVDLANAADLDDAVDAIGAALLKASDQAEGRLAVVRLVLEGTSPAHAHFAAQRERLMAECHAAAARVSSQLWIEKVEVRTRPIFEQTATAARADAIGALIRSVDALARDDEARAALSRELNELVSRLPDELKGRWWKGGVETLGGGSRSPSIDESSLGTVIAAARNLLAVRILDAEGEA